MLFHAPIFFVFFAIVYPVHLALRPTRFMMHWLLIASYVFYGWWNPLYLALIVVSTAIDYGVVLLMQRSRRRKWWLAVSVVMNLGLLAFFKYAGWITENLNAVGVPIPAPDILLPVGISFFTFQSMSYTIDAYRGRLAAEPNFIRFAAYVALFPQLVAGPIERARDLLPQLRSAPPIGRRDIEEGLSLFFVGYFKKVALADYLALYVDRVYGAPHEFQSAALLLATFAFGWQIYFDFSGYTDMARGVARLMGFRLMVNFNAPYAATGLGDFWNRWHISLSSWFRDYVYIPLGGNRSGTYRNILITMLLSGLWHGAAWGFVIWGALHAAGRMLTRELERSEFYERLPRIVKQTFVFAFVTFAWIFFRARTWGDSWTIVSRIFASGWADPRFPLVLLAMVLIVWAYQLTSEARTRPLVQASPVRIAAALFMVAWLAIVSQPASQDFIYFQF
ncbi:MAG: MBOAT family protein [Planctomycetes bacterium]|nr:MBOAT family protein [Planctomycetota bacterium]